MKMTHWLLLGITLLGAACARVQVEAPKDPIKMDISMRLDVYQHIAKDVDTIEDLVRGKSDTQSAWAEWLVGTAYAEDLSPAVREAALRRRARLSQIEALQRQGALGESANGLLVVRSASADGTSLAAQENTDRQIMFDDLARSGGTSPDQVGRVFAKRLQSEAPAGTPIESENGSWTAK